MDKIMYKKINQYYNWGARLISNQFQIIGKKATKDELLKTPSRTEIINLTLSKFSKETVYLEIGVRRPEDNFNKINSSKKYSVDPGIENPKNPVDFPFTSDEFFYKLKKGEILSKDIRFDVIFIDGLHLANQVERDIENSLSFLSENGFILLHDCNPPTEWHAREEYYYDLTPAEKFWNGTTWKAFYKYRADQRLTSACIDTDWGVGILTKDEIFSRLSELTNHYFEYKVLHNNRTAHLNLISFEDYKKILFQE
jgi:hypothetical protein